MTKLRKGSEQEKFTEFLYGILQDKLHQSGGELNDALVEKFGVSKEYARQIVHRAASSHAIKSSRPYKFGNGQFIYLLPDQDISVLQVQRICQTKRPPLFRLLTHMREHNGVISFYDAMKITASPDMPSSTKVENLPDMIKVLVKLNLVIEEQDENGVNYILIKENWLDEEQRRAAAKPLMAAYYNKMVMDSSLIPDILRWLSKSNLIVTTAPMYRNKKSPSIGAKHNNLLWDAYSYSKATGINPVKAVSADSVDKQTLVVLDVVLSEDYSQLDLDGFYNRVQININSVKLTARKIMPVVVYKSCPESVLNRIRALGFLAFDIASIFGTKIYAVLGQLNELNNLLINDSDVESSVRKVLKVIRSSGQEDALKDLKGVLFETLMFPVLKKMFPNASIARGKYISNGKKGQDKEGYEYDYIFNASNPEEIVVVELKGYNENVFIPLGTKEKKASLRWFFNRTLPFAKKFYQHEINQGKSFRGLYITSASFYEDGREFIVKLNQGSLKPHGCDIAYERRELLAMLRSNGFDNEVKIIEKFYVGRAEGNAEEPND